MVLQKLKSVSLAFGIVLMVTLTPPIAYAFDPDEDKTLYGKSRIIFREAIKVISDEVDETIGITKSLLTSIGEKVPISKSLRIKAMYSSMLGFCVLAVAYDINNFLYQPNCLQSMPMDLVQPITGADLGGSNPIFLQVTTQGLLYHLPELQDTTVTGTRKIFIGRVNSSSFFELTQKEYRPAEFGPYAAPPRSLCSYILPGDNEPAETCNLTIYRAMKDTFTGLIVSYLWPSR
jgi:hypothetical protein